MLALRSMEAMEKVADGQATKIIVPSEMQNLEMCIRDSRRTVTEIILPKNFQEDDIAKVQEYIEFLQYKKEQAKDRK